MATRTHLVPVTFDELVPSVFEAAYQRLLPQMLALDEDDFAAQVLDIVQVTITVRGAAAKLRPLRDEVAKLPYTNVACIDDLEDVARAVLYANAVHVTASKPPPARVELGARGARLRTRLYTDARALEARVLLEDASVKSYRGTVGYRVISMDLITLATALEAAWPAIAGKTALTRKEIAGAWEIADALSAAVAEREPSPERVAEAVRMRRRAYNLLLVRYDAARRAVGYLRWDTRDADAYAPSLYAGRGNGNHKRAEPAEAASPKKAESDGVPSAPIALAAEDDPFSA